MNPGSPYERITQLIFQEILDQDVIPNVEVRRNVEIQGKTVAHKIDVYWEFVLGSVVYRTVVEVKHWNRRVDLGRLLLFQGVLNDLPGQPRGIVVTRSGYQRSAMKYALANGILLYVVDQVPDPPNPGIVMTNTSRLLLRYLGRTNDQRMVMECTTFIPDFTNATCHIDVAWLDELKSRFGPDIAREVQATHFRDAPHEISFYDVEGNQTGTLRDVYVALVKEMCDESLLKRDAVKTFQQPTFLRITSPEVPFIKITAISVTVNIQRTVSQLVGLPSVVEFVMKNLNEKTPKSVLIPRKKLEHMGN